jgi:5-methylthioribose kinase
MIPFREISRFLAAHGLIDPSDELRCTPLAGGVSSDVWHVEGTVGKWCVKRALPLLKTDRYWEAPVSRSASEWNFLTAVAAIHPPFVPQPIAYDGEAGFLAMEWLSPSDFRLWKDQLFDGSADPASAAALAQGLGDVHAASSADPEYARFFANDALFEALRIAPYLREAAHRNPDVAGAIHDLESSLANNRRALVHGDVSPKNVLVSSTRVVLLDAECACFGDPAFDVAFCLTHLAVKRSILQSERCRIDRSIDAFLATYLSTVTWERPQAIEGRASRLLPVLVLARVDGKSPLSYLEPDAAAALRSAALARIGAPPEALVQVIRSFSA